jgi:hypothetical protein
MMGDLVLEERLDVFPGRVRDLCGHALSGEERQEAIDRDAIAGSRGRRLVPRPTVPEVAGHQVLYRWSRDHVRLSHVASTFPVLLAEVGVQQEALWEPCTEVVNPITAGRLGRLAQGESASLTRKRSEVQIL